MTPNCLQSRVFSKFAKIQVKRAGLSRESIWIGDPNRALAKLFVPLYPEFYAVGFSRIGERGGSIMRMNKRVNKNGV